MTATSSSRLKILWTLPYFPWPTNNGGKTRAHALLRQMADRGHEITLLVLSKTVPGIEDLAYLQSFLKEVIVVPRRRRAHPGTLMSSVFSTVRPAVATINGVNAAYVVKLGNLLGADFDVVHAEHTYGYASLEIALKGVDVPVVLSEANLESKLVEQQYWRLGWPLREFARLDQIRARRWEKRVMRQVNCVVAVTEADRDAFVVNGARAAMVVPNCIDSNALAKVVRNPEELRVSFLGNYEYAPNVAAVELLCDAIMPMIWMMMPTVRLAILGHSSRTSWRDRWPDPRIEFKGYVSNLAETYEQSSVFIAPLRAGGGSKLKVLEAMAAGLPVVGTWQAVSGLAVKPARHFLHGEEADELADATMKALRNGPEIEEIANCARSYVQAHHDWTISAALLESILQWAAGPATRAVRYE